MVLGKPVEIVDDGCRPVLDAAMVAIDRRVLADLALMEVALFLLGYEQRDILVQSRLVPLDRQDILGLLVEERLSNHALAAHSVDCYDGTLNINHGHESGARRATFRILVAIYLAHTNPTTT